MIHILGRTRESTNTPVTEDGSKENQQTGEGLDGTETKSQDEALADETLAPEENGQKKQSETKSPAHERSEDPEESDARPLGAESRALEESGNGDENDEISEVPGLGETSGVRQREDKTPEDTLPEQAQSELPVPERSESRLDDVPSSPEGAPDTRQSASPWSDVEHLMLSTLWLAGGFIPILFSTLNRNDDPAWLLVPLLQGKHQ